ncbi:GMC oxidoreductase, partial [Sphaerobolus stellatus SS14]
GPTPFANRPRRTFTTINSVLYAPISRGRTHINSSDPLAFPQVDPNYWGHPMDIAAHVGGAKLARKMLRTPPLLSIFDGEFEPGDQFQTDEEIEGWLRGVVASDNHEVGTASMLPEELGGVVDTSLKVYGTNNVRVADASIIPFTVSSHLSSTIYAIGEKVILASFSLIPKKLLTMTRRQISSRAAGEAIQRILIKFLSDLYPLLITAINQSITENIPILFNYRNDTFR